MMRVVTAVCALFCLVVVAPAIEIDDLLTSTGSEFQKALDAIASDGAVVSRLRAAPFSGANGVELRRELMRKVVLAKVDTPDLFNSFDAMVSMIRPDSPMYSPGRWEAVASSMRIEPDVSMLRDALTVWYKSPPVNAGEWVGIFREPQLRATRSVADERHMSNRYWPLIAYGLTGEPARLRKWTIGAFDVLEPNENRGELLLESLLWLCERTDYYSSDFVDLGPSNVVSRYRAEVYALLTSPDGDKTRLITRILAMFEAGEKFIKADKKPVVYGWLNFTEKFGGPSHVPALRRLADMPIWSAYREVMLDLAKKLGSNSPDKSQMVIVTRQLLEIEERTTELIRMMDRGLSVPLYLDDAEEFGTPAHAPVLRKLAESPFWSAHRARMLQVADKLEKAADKPKVEK